MRRLLMSVFAATLFVFLLFAFDFATQTVSGQPGANMAPLATATATVFPTPPPFSATLILTPSQRYLELGETLVVTVAVSVSQGCVFPVLELSLLQPGDEGAIFEYISPYTHTVNPSSIPFSYTLMAEYTGTVVFSGMAYGERYCGDYWNRTYVGGRSGAVRVGAWPDQVYLPLICR